jgi:glycosyltransferase involved in cell wall biosynthesis
MKPLKITIYTEGLEFNGDTLKYSALGGSETAVICVAEELNKLGHKVTVFNNCDNPRNYNGIEYHKVSEFDSYREKPTDIFICSRFFQVLRKEINSKVNIYWTHDAPPAFNVHDFMTALPFIDKIFVVSDYQKELYKKSFSLPEKIFFDTKNGINLEWFKEKTKRDNNKLLFMSSFERGLEQLLLMFPKIKKTNPKAELYVSGYFNPLLNSITKDMHDRTINKMARMEGVHFLGYLNKEEMIKELKSARLLLYPSICPEIFCILAIEAQMAGTPMIATNFAAFPETVEKAGVLIKGGASKASYQTKYIKAVNELLSNGEEWKRLSEYGKRRAKEFTWKQIIEEWQEYFYKELEKVEKRKVPTISLCMITKNAQKTLYRCLESVKDHVDEIHICDTGSTDDTIKVAKTYTNNVREIGWRDDFAWARNESIKNAKGDWILWVDADECLINGHLLKKYILRDIVEGFIVKQSHEASDAGNGYHVDRPIRFFRNNIGMKFVGCVHEHPGKDINHHIDIVSEILSADIRHDGYITEEVRRKRFERNWPLVLKDRKVNPKRKMGLLFLARGYLNKATQELEKNNGEINSKVLEYCKKVKDIHLKHFKNPTNNMFYRHTHQFYDKALTICREGYEIGWMLAGDENPLPRGIRAPFQKRRFQNVKEIKEFFSAKIDELAHQRGWK